MKDVIHIAFDIQKMLRFQLQTTVQKTSTTDYGNSLPPHLRDADLPYSRFRQSLKTFLFG